MANVNNDSSIVLKLDLTKNVSGISRTPSVRSDANKSVKNRVADIEVGGQFRGATHAPKLNINSGESFSPKVQDILKQFEGLSYEETSALKKAINVEHETNIGDVGKFLSTEVDVEKRNIILKKTVAKYPDLSGDITELAEATALDTNLDIEAVVAGVDVHSEAPSAKIEVSLPEIKSGSVQS